MEDRTKNKMKAAGKIAWGLGKGASSVMLATGHGILGTLMKRQHMTATAIHLAEKELKSAKKDIDEGVRKWNDA